MPYRRRLNTKPVYPARFLPDTKDKAERYLKKPGNEAWKDLAALLESMLIDWVETQERVHGRVTRVAAPVPLAPEDFDTGGL